MGFDNLKEAAQAARIKSLEEKLRFAEAVLEFYAHEPNWTTSAKKKQAAFDFSETFIAEDQGEQARQALAKLRK